MSYQSFEQVLQKCHKEEKEFWRVILEDDMAERNVSEEDSMEHMRVTWDAMLLAAATYEGNLNSSSGLVGGDGRRMEEYIHSAVTESLCGDKRFDFGVVARARRENDDRYATVGAERTNEISAVSVW